MRTATQRDVARISFVHVESWRSTYRGLVPDEFLERLSVEQRVPMWAALVADETPTSAVLVLEDATGVIGFSHFAPSRDEDADGATGEVTSIYLLESSWSRGGGTLLLDAVTTAMRDSQLSKATLWVLDRNERARLFYERLGWAFDGAEKTEDRETFQLHELRYSRPL